MLLIKILFFICLLIISLLIIRKIDLSLNKRILEVQGNEEFLKKKFKRLESKISSSYKCQSIFEKRRKKLKQAGNPYHLTPFTYYIIKTVPAFIVLLIFIFKNMLLRVDSIILILLIYYLVDILQFVRNKKDNNEIKLDLPKMYDLLSIQDAAGINIGMALTDLFDVVKNKRLKFRLIELSANIIITKNLETSLDSFMENFNLPELESFVIGIKQSEKTGAGREMIENQSEIMKEVAVDDKTVEIKNVSIKISIALIFMFLGISLLIIFSFSKLLGSSLKFLFQ